MSSMIDSLEKFSKRIHHVEKVLSEAKNEVLDQESNILSILEKAGNDLRGIAQENKGESDAMKKAMEGLLSSWSDGLIAWKTKMQESSSVRQRIEEFGTGLIVAVFGRTNAGKSTLGNFIRGQSLKDAPFENPWKTDKFKPSPIMIVESAESEPKISGEWFAEGATETTQETQLFTLPADSRGLLWLDTPGFGSTKPELGELAKKYVKRADVVIYVEHADSPGQMSITQELAELLAYGHKTILVINQSDDEQKVIGPDGKYVRENGLIKRIIIPKSPEVRADHEAQIKQSLYDLDFQGDCEAISISMLLTKMGIENNNNKYFAQGNIGALFDEICALVEKDEDIKKLKFNEGRLALVGLIDEILGERQELNITGQNLKKILDDLSNTISRFNSIGEKFIPSRETVAIASPIILEAKKKISDKVGNIESNAKGNSSNLDIDLKDITDHIRNTCNDAITSKAHSILKDLWNNSKDLNVSFQEISCPKLERQVEEFEYVVTTTVEVERDPDGIIETVCSIFGKKYHRTELSTEKATQTIDLGYNTDDFIAKINTSLDKTIKDYILCSLENIKNVCINESISKLRTMKKCLTDSIKAFHERRKTLESQIN